MQSRVPSFSMPGVLAAPERGTRYSSRISHVIHLLRRPALRPINSGIFYRDVAGLGFISTVLLGLPAGFQGNESEIELMGSADGI